MFYRASSGDGLCFLHHVGIIEKKNVCCNFDRKQAKANQCKQSIFTKEIIQPKKINSQGHHSATYTSVTLLHYHFSHLFSSRQGGKKMQLPRDSPFTNPSG